MNPDAGFERFQQQQQQPHLNESELNSRVEQFETITANWRGCMPRNGCTCIKRQPEQFDSTADTNDRASWTQNRLAMPSCPLGDGSLSIAPKTTASAFAARPPFSWTVLWDMENVGIPRGYTGAEAVRRIRAKIATVSAQDNVDVIRRIVVISNVFNIRITLRNELQANGVNLQHVETRGRKDAADKALIAEMCMTTLDQAPPSGIVLLSGDQDFAYPLARIRDLGYCTILIAPHRKACSPLLTSVPDIVWSFQKDVLADAKIGRASSHPTRYSGRACVSASPMRRARRPRTVAFSRPTPTGHADCVLSEVFSLSQEVVDMQHRLLDIAEYGRSNNAKVGGSDGLSARTQRTHTKATNRKPMASVPRRQAVAHTTAHPRDTTSRTQMPDSEETRGPMFRFAAVFVYIFFYSCYVINIVHSGPHTLLAALLYLMAMVGAAVRWLFGEARLAVPLAVICALAALVRHCTQWCRTRATVAGAHNLHKKTKCTQRQVSTLRNPRNL